MPSNPYDTSTLISLVKNLESIPTNQNTFTDEDFVNLMNYAFQNEVTPLLLKTNEEYFVTFKDFNVTNTTQYIEIPREAVGMRCRDVWWVPNGNLSNGFVILPRIQPEVLSNGGWSPGGNCFNGGSGYYLQSNRIMFYPQLQQSGTVRVYYFRRPNRLTTTTMVGEIVSIDTGANTVTLDTAPDTTIWDTGSILDAIHNYQPFDFAEAEIEVVARTGLTFEFAPDVIANLAVGDWLSTTGYSAFLQYVPVEAQGVVVQGTALKCLQSVGDSDGWKIADAVYTKLKSELLDMVTPRVQGQPKKIGNRGRGIMNGNINRNGWGGSN